MIRKLKLLQAGESVRATLPKTMVDRLQLKAGDWVLALDTEQGILLTPYDPETETTVEFATKAAKKHRAALRELAK
jgi:putative addiction module antidote